MYRVAVILLLAVLLVVIPLPGKVSIEADGMLSVGVAYAHPAAPVLESDWTVNDSGGAAVTSITLTKPAGVSNDDLLLLIVGNDESNVADWEPLASWNMIVDFNNAGADAALAVYWRVATGDASETDPAPTCTSNEAYGWYIRVSGADTTTPIHITGTPAGVVASPYTIGEVTTTADDCLVFYASAFDGGGAGSFSESGAGWAEVDEQYSGTAGTDACGVWGTKTMSGQGATGDVSVTLGTTDGTSSVQFAVQPPVACSPDISNTPSTYDFGVVAESANYTTGITNFTVTNSSGGAVDISIQGTDMTGGTTWTLSDTATAGSNTYGLKAGLDDADDNYDVIVKKTAVFNDLITGLADNTTQDWGLQFFAPTSMDDGAEKTCTVTLTAVCQ